MKNFLDEFKAFALKGNVVDLAIAVVVGGAFNRIVSSLVDNIIMPLFGILLGGVDFDSLAIGVDGAEIMYGVFLQAIVDFLIIALSIFLAIKIARSMRRTEDTKPPEEKVVEPSEEVKLLREIRDALRTQ